MPMTWSRKGPHQELPKYSAGKVAKIEKVASDWSLAIPALPLKSLMAQLYAEKTTPAARKAPRSCAPQ